MRLVYGIPSEILLKEADLDDPIVILNSVGSRQGCPFGSFLYALAQQPILEQLAAEFEHNGDDLDIVAFCDDVWFLAEPEVAARAFKRYKYLYAETFVAP